MYVAKEVLGISTRQPVLQRSLTSASHRTVSSAAFCKQSMQQHLQRLSHCKSAHGVGSVRYLSTSNDKKRYRDDTGIRNELLGQSGPLPRGANFVLALAEGASMVFVVTGLLFVLTTVPDWDQIRYDNAQRVKEQFPSVAAWLLDGVDMQLVRTGSPEERAQQRAAGHASAATDSSSAAQVSSSASSTPAK